MGPGRNVGTPAWLTLEDQEQIWLKDRPSKNLLLATFVVGTVLLISLGVFAAVLPIDVGTGRTITAVVLLVVFVLTGGVYLVTRRREYVVTSQRVCEAVGLTSKEVTSIDLADLEDVAFEQSNWQTWLHIGSILFVAGDETAIRFDFLEDPQWVYERILDYVDAVDEAMADAGRD